MDGDPLPVGLAPVETLHATSPVHAGANLIACDAIKIWKWSSGTLGACFLHALRADTCHPRVSEGSLRLYRIVAPELLPRYGSRHRKRVRCRWPAAVRLEHLRQ